MVEYMASMPIRTTLFALLAALIVTGYRLYVTGYFKEIQEMIKNNKNIIKKMKNIKGKKYEKE